MTGAAPAGGFLFGTPTELVYDGRCFDDAITAATEWARLTRDRHTVRQGTHWQSQQPVWLVTPQRRPAPTPTR